ncbi:GMC family oxidoreductase N-terminal domain-containing protein [Massilia scottii]|uniref:GMC family oxidoreductase N-terminal domain-containing protein n=1 Tax=Massilia scottii TaxID=3057166 RepID=UPI0027967412|nr:GMC family oxidoreductase N-terminal domain-containing protein [Massilia sp. CCM 9029]MDQ1829153.1 FAD-dependent oxidoreductase [Massilia sp. CCM 9029]
MKIQKDNEFDAIVIGSGTCGATIARELSRQKKKVLILERGADAALRETFMGIASIANQVFLGDDKLSTVRALTTGGSTSLYFGVVNYPQEETFRNVGIDLSKELDAVRKELPIAPLPDSLLGSQAIKLRDSANALGHTWKKNDMLVDLTKCGAGYSYDAKWKAKSYVEDAVADGATLINRATVLSIIIEGNVAVGVEYRIKTSMFASEVKRAFGTKIVVAAGELATPTLLRDSGVQGIGQRGFYCNPGYAIYGLIPGLNASSGFVGSMGCEYEDGIELGDANIPQSLHRPMMLGGMKLRHLMGFSDCIGIGVKVKDKLSGRLKEDGRFFKDFDSEDIARLNKGKDAAIRILKQAGAEHIVDFGLTAAGRVGGLVSIGEHVDHKLETQFRNLHVCDGSVIPDDMRGTPTVTLVSMGRYLSKHLLNAM